jgi:hypothetical protein
MDGKNRRGLGEIVTLTSVLVVIGCLLAIQLSHNQEMNATLLGILVGLTTAQVSRGTTSAMERGASTDLRNYESSVLGAAADDLKKEREQMQAMQAEWQRAQLAMTQQISTLMAKLAEQGARA